MPEFIYQMRGVRKAHGDKVILENVTLAFLPGAKIGVVGPNGMGKSTLLRMMAGVEQPSNGEARLMPGFTVGHDLNRGVANYLRPHRPAITEDDPVTTEPQDVAEGGDMIDEEAIEQFGRELDGLREAEVATQTIDRDQAADAAASSAPF